MKLSEHALARCRERGIELGTISIVTSFGAATPKPNGRSAYALRSIDIQDASTAGVSADVLRAARHVIVIVGDQGAVVTAWRRTPPVVRADRITVHRKVRRGVRSTCREIARGSVEAQDPGVDLLGGAR